LVGGNRSPAFDPARVTRRPRLLFVQPSLQPPGGGNGVAAWMLQALKDDYDITVVRMTASDELFASGFGNVGVE